MTTLETSLFKKVPKLDSRKNILQTKLKYIITEGLKYISKLLVEKFVKIYS